MLHRLDGTGAWGFGHMDWDGAAALARRLMEGLGLAGMMFLLCRVRLAGQSPFALAFMAAALLAGRSAAALLVGCLAGAANGGLAGFDLRLPVGAAIVLGGNVARDLLEPSLRNGEGRLGRALARLRPGRDRRRAPMMQARSPNGREAAACAALAGAGVLIPGLAGLGEALWPEAVAVVAASVAAVAAAPFLRSALAAGLERRWLNAEERTGLFLAAGLLAAGLSRLYPPLALCAAAGLAQLLYPCGALAGVGLGGALAAMTGEVRLLGLTAVGGAAAQLCPELSRPARSACAGGAMLVAGLLLDVSAGLLAWACLSAAVAAALPGRAAAILARLARPAPQACDPARLAARVQRGSVRRLRALGAAFGELAEGYAAPGEPPDEQDLIRRLRDRLCAGCGGYGDCWGGPGDGGARLLCDLIARAAALGGEAPLFEGEAPPELSRRCRRGRLIPERLQEPLEDFARARREAQRRGAENRLISAQFLQARRLLEELAARQARPLAPGLRRANRAASALERAGVPVEGVTALGDELSATLRRGRWSAAQARTASKRLTQALGRVYAPAGPLGRELRFVRRPPLAARAGILCASRQAGTPCGDSHLVCSLEDGRLLALISDGMGSGDAAARESAVAVRLLGRFLRAGASCALAVETVNALLLNRGGEDMFATVDMLLVDLSTGAAELVKLAACPTLIAREGRVLRLEGGRLPLGILEKVSADPVRTRLLPGDVLLMASDGVTDALEEGALEALLLSGEGHMPALAHRVLSAAEAACRGGRRDDMTVLCLRIERRSVNPCRVCGTGE